jgi:predicted Zn-dependent protease
MDKRKCYFVILLIAALLVPGKSWGLIDFNPALEEEEIIFVPAEKERNMGRNIDRKVQEKFDIPVDPLMQKRIEEIGERLAKGSDRRDIVYYFRVIDVDEKDTYNAFAAPGGYIYIFRDLVDAMETDDKIAAVLAHEMAHVEAKHSIKRMQGALGATALLVLGSQMNTDGSNTMAKANTAIGQLMYAYSREDEKKADELSLKYMEQAGFNPKGTVESLECLKALRKKGPLRKYSYFRSHPYVSQRIAHLQKMIKGYVDFDSYVNSVSETGS